jgi:hypothetical protein
MMARNYFNGSAADVLGAGQQGWEDTQGKIDGLMQRRTNVQAGRQYGAGDRMGAARTFAEGGNIDAARTIEGDQAKADETAYQHTRDVKADEGKRFDEAKSRYEFMGGLVGELGQVPEGQRAAVLKARLPILQHLKFPPELVQQIASLDDAHLTNDQLQAFGAKLQQEWKVYQTTRGGLTAVRNVPGGKIETQELRKADPAPPGMMMQDEDGNWVPNPAYVAAKGAVARATRAPPRPRAPGGGGGGLGGIKTEDLIAALRK